MSLKVTGTRQLFTAPKGEKGDKGDDGRSVTLKGRIYAHSRTIPLDYDKIDAPVYAVDSPFCLYWWNETAEEYVQETPDIGDGYVIDNPGAEDDGKLYSSDGSHWLGPYDFKGDPGEPGDDAELYQLLMTEAWARWEYDNSNDEWVLKCCIKGEAWFIKGGNRVSASSGLNYENQRIRIRYNNGRELHYANIAGDGSWEDGTNGNYMEDDVYDESRVGQPESIIVDLIGKDISDSTTVLDSKTIAIVWDGEPGGKGEDGDPGPMGIPAGAYSSSARYERTSEIVPIVEHNGEYWFPKNKGVLTNSEPSANNNNWKKAENFEVMFVKILFAAFAKLGEAIFHGNFMFSQNGKVNGAASNNYQLFSPSDPDNEGSASRFAPNLYLNFLTGAARLAAGKALFFADGRGSLAGGNLTWDALGNVTVTGFVRRSKTIITTENIEHYKRDDITSAVVLDFDKCGSFIQLNTGTSGYFALPLLCSGLANRYTSEQKDRIRSFVGTKMMIHNNSGRSMTIVYKMWGSNAYQNSFTLYNGVCSELECVLEQDDDETGHEMIYWKVNRTVEPV